MKHINMLLSFLSLVLIWGACAKEMSLVTGGETVLHVGIENTKTALNGLKVVWTEGDQIVVNGQKSTGISIQSDPSKASFTLPAVSAPYYALYPGNAYVGGSQYGSLVLPEQQNYVKDSFDPAAALMFGVSQSSADGISFHHGVSYVKLVINGAVYKDDIKRVELSPLGTEDMSGQMDFEPSSMALVNKGNEGKGVKITGNIAQGQPIVIALAARTYASGIKLRIVDVKNHYMDVKSAKSFTAKPGTIFKTDIAYAPTGTIIDAGTEDSKSCETKKVLFIGNSHDLDATAHLPFIMNKQGVRSFEFTRVFHGGYWLQAYNTNYELANNCSITVWKPGQQSWRGVYSYNYSLKDAVEAEKYDIVVIQEYAGKSTCWNWNQAERDAIKGLVEKIRKSSPDADIYYFLSHCFADDYQVVTDNFDGDSDKQFAACVEGNGKHIADPSEGFGFKGLISTGALLQNLRTTGLNVYNSLLRGDGVHLDYGMTRIAASLLLWKHLFAPSTGITPEMISYRLSEYYPAATQHTTPFNDQNRAAVLAAVNAAYEKPLAITDLGSYASKPSYVHTPGESFMNLTGVDVEPCTFPVNFRLGYSGGIAQNSSDTQGCWNQYGIIQSKEQPQAFLKYVYVSTPVEGKIFRRTYANRAADNLSSFAVDAVWTGDYYEFVIPVKNFKAGTTVRFSAPFYTRQGPVFWYMDYLDGNEWKCNHSTKTAWAGGFSRDASFAIRYGKTSISEDMTFVNGIPSGFLHFRLRCADGTIQADETAAVERSSPSMSSGSFNAVFYFWGDSNKISFSIIK